MYDYETEDIENLLYYLIDKPKAEKQEEFYKLNGYPADSLDVNKPKTDPELISRLKTALENMSLAVPVFEMRSDEVIVDIDADNSFLFEHKLKSTFRASRRLRSIISASIPARKMHSLLEHYAYSSRLIETKTGDVLVIFIPIAGVLNYKP
ncbi:MAG TPA: hypothetical protein VGE58_04180 [Daejeonella sp.]